MQYHTIERTGFKLSKIGLGTWQFGDSTGTYAKQNQEVADEIVQTALRGGINFFDTAEGYGSGESERTLARALEKAGVKREDYFLASKVSQNHLSPDKLVAALEESLKNLGTSYIDLYQIHWPTSGVDWKETFQTLKKLKEEGKIRAIGLSNFGKSDICNVTQVEIATNQLPYSLVTRNIETEILDKCKAEKMSVIAYSPLAQGLLTGKYKTLEDALANPGLCRSRLFAGNRSSKSRHEEPGCEEELFQTIHDLLRTAKEFSQKGVEVSPSQLALGWALLQNGIDIVLVGASSPQQLSDTLRTMELLPNLQKEEQLLLDLTRSSNPIKEKLRHPDLWDSVSRIN